MNTSTPCIVSSIKQTTIDVKFHDPENFLKDATIHYFWFINTVNYGQTTEVRDQPWKGLYFEIFVFLRDISSIISSTPEITTWR